DIGELSILLVGSVGRLVKGPGHLQLSTRYAAGGPRCRCSGPQSRYNRYFGLRPALSHTTPLRAVSRPAVARGAGPQAPTRGRIMAFNPFASFRKHQKYWMAGAVLVCMLTFVLRSGGMKGS